MRIEQDIENHPHADGWSGGVWGDAQPIHGRPGPPDDACIAWMQAAEDAGRERARQYAAAMARGAVQTSGNPYGPAAGYTGREQWDGTAWM